MSSYGVPDDPDGLLPWAWAEERLVANRNYWVVTVDALHRPHAMPVWGVWMIDTERFWFSAAPDAFKVRNIESNPHVVVATADTVEVVSVEGTAELRTDDEGAAAAWGEKYGTSSEEQAELAAFFPQGAMICVTPVKAFGLIETPEDFGPRATRWVW